MGVTSTPSSRSDPDVVLHADFGARRAGAPRTIHGAAAVARQALRGAAPAAQLHLALIGGAAGAVVSINGRPFAVLGFSVSGGRIVEMDVIAGPDRVGRIAAALLGAE